jgi:23S rRNA (pseudouridine1915-N3)-methyltransferase
MRLVVAAVGQRLPDWAQTAVDEFSRRLPAECRVEIRAVKADPRSSGRTAAQSMAAEAERLTAAAPRGARRIVLDEAGARLTTLQLAERLRFWLGDGRDVVFFIGGADGLDPALQAQADERLRLSDLTLPHALARVLLVEALYRAWTVLQGHPYHRE